MSDTYRIAVVGGSIAGCAAAVELSRAGHKVKVFERSATELVSQWAGIIAPAEVFRGMVARNLLPEDHPRCSVTVARYVRRDGDRAEGRWLGDVDFNLTTVSWADLFHELRRQAPPGAYHNGIEVHGLASDNDAALVTMKTSEGTHEQFDLIVFADGYRSLGRPIVAPGTNLRYRGLVFWRGLISSAEADIDRLDGAVTRVVYPGGHGAVYLIPAAREAAVPGNRTAMWGYYLPVPADTLSSVLTESNGQHTPRSRPSTQQRYRRTPEAGSASPEMPERYFPRSAAAAYSRPSAMPHRCTTASPPPPRSARDYPPGANSSRQPSRPSSQLPSESGRTSFPRSRTSPR